MATTNNITSTYVGKDSGQFISPILYGAPTLGVPGVTIRSNVNWKSRITTIALSGIIKDQTCAWDATGTVNQGENWLQVKPLEVNLELCKADYYDDFIGQDMGCKDSLPADFLRYMVGEIGNVIADDLETKIWQGAAGAGSFDGYTTKFKTDATVLDVDNAAAALTSTTIIAEARKVFAAAPAALLAASDVYLYMNAKSAQLLREAQNDKGNASPCGENCVALDGITIFVTGGIPDNEMVLARKANLFFGTWMQSDIQSIGVKDMSEFFEQNVRFAACFFAGVGYGYGAEVVYYWNATP